jgi:hypothetical protein
MSGVGKPSRHALRIRNAATYRFGKEFHKTALKAGSPIVRAYLLGHALELYLKTYLLLSGASTTELKKRYGHNLVSLLNAARKVGTGSEFPHVSLAADRDIALLLAVYPEKLRYFSLASLFVPPTLPALGVLFKLARSFDSQLAERTRIAA